MSYRADNGQWGPYHPGKATIGHNIRISVPGTIEPFLSCNFQVPPYFLLSHNIYIYILFNFFIIIILEISSNQEEEEEDFDGGKEE